MSAMSQLTNIFVYGTLKKGQCRAAFLDGQVYRGEAKTVAAYRMFDCGTYPGMIASKPGVEIIGEVWTVDDECLAALDELEGVDEVLYRRDSIRMKAPFHQSDVFGYLYLQSTDGLRDCGQCW